MSPAIEPMLTTQPSSAPRRSSAAARAQYQGAMRLTASTCCQTSSVAPSRSSRGIGIVAPALFTSTPIGPSCSRVAATIARTAASSVTSACTATARPPSAVISSTSDSASSAERRYEIATGWPARCRARLQARPMPVPPPVTSAVLTSRSSWRLTSPDTRRPSACPATFGWTTFITAPICFGPSAPVSAMAAATIAVRSSSESWVGR